MQPGPGHKWIVYVVILLPANILPTGLRDGETSKISFCIQFCPLCDKQVIVISNS